MKIGHFIPAYRQDIKVTVAYSLAHDLVWAMQAGHDLQPFFADFGQIERARNWAVKHAIAKGCDLLLMQDSDVHVICGGLGRLYRTMMQTSSSVVGALICCRDGEKMNAEPARPGEIYDGEVGTGLMLIDLRQVSKALPLPWFSFKYNEDHTDIETGEDIAFCRAVTAAGLRVVVDATIETLHYDERPLVYQPPGAVNLEGADTQMVASSTAPSAKVKAA
jgi:hypothetical protein